MKKLLGTALLLVGIFLFAPGAHAAEVTASAVTTMSPAEVAQLSIVLANLRATLDVLDVKIRTGQIPEAAKPTLNMTLAQLSVTLANLKTALPQSTAGTATGGYVAVAPSAPAPRPGTLSPVTPPVAPQAPIAQAPPAPSPQSAAPKPVGTAQALDTNWNRQMPWVIAAIVLFAIGIGYSRREAAPEMIARGPINEPAENAMPIEVASSEAPAPAEPPKPTITESSAPAAPAEPPRPEAPVSEEPKQ